MTGRLSDELQNDGFKTNYSRGNETMIRTLVIATMLVAAGPALAQSRPSTKPPKEVTVSGCTRRDLPAAARCKSARKP